MQPPNVMTAFLVSFVVLVAYVFWVKRLKDYCSNKTEQSFMAAATGYGGYMAAHEKGYTQCDNVQTRSGNHTDVFFDVDNFLSDSSNCEYVTSWITKAVLDAKTEALAKNQNISGLAFIEKDSGPTGLISLQHLIASRTGMKTCVIRLRRWPFLAQAAIKGVPPLDGTKWVIISDVATTGGHIEKAAMIMRDKSWGADVFKAIVLLALGEKELFDKMNSVKIKITSNDNILARFKAIKEEKKAA